MSGLPEPAVYAGLVLAAIRMLPIAGQRWLAFLRDLDDYREGRRSRR